MENIFKRWIKKKISYSITLFITFMMTGNLANAEIIEIIDINNQTEVFNLQKEEQNFLGRIEKLKEEIKEKIRENNEKIKELNSNLFELVDRGDYYSKPIWKSNQVFFNYQKIISGTVKNKTKSEWKVTIDDVAKRYKNLKENEIIRDLYDMNGNQINGDIFTESIKLGANVKEPKVKLWDADIDIKIKPIEDLDIDVSFTPKVIKPIVVPNPNVKERDINIPEPNANPFNEFYLNIDANPHQISTYPEKILWERNTYIFYWPLFTDYQISGGTFWSGVVKPQLDKDGNVINTNKDGQLESAEKAGYTDVIGYGWGYGKDGDAISNREIDKKVWGIFALKFNNDIGTPPYKIQLKNIKMFLKGKKQNIDMGEYTDLKSKYYATKENISKVNEKIEKLKKENKENTENTEEYRTIQNELNEEKEKIKNNIKKINSILIDAGTVGIATYTAYTNTQEYTLSNISATLYDYSNFLSLSLPGTTTTYEDIKINVKGNDTTIFRFIETPYPTARPGREEREYNFLEQYSKYKSNRIITKEVTYFDGKIDVNIDNKRNILYSINTYLPSLHLTQAGEVNFNGAGNIGFSDMGYAPNRKIFIRDFLPDLPEDEQVLSEYTPRYIMQTPINIYGDENVGAYFAPRKSVHSKYFFGVYQGFMNLDFNIGTKLNNKLDHQDKNGNLDDKGYKDTHADMNIGVFSESGQREGIASPMGDISQYAGTRMESGTLDKIKSDKIHNLYLDKFEIKFGKYSKNGIMFVAKNGSVIEILPHNPTRPNGNNVQQNNFSDGIKGKDTEKDDVATGTIIAYAEGTWNKGKNFLEAETGFDLEGKPSEVKIGQSLDMVSNDGITFMAINGGKVSFNANYLKATGKNTIIGYAKDGGNVVVDGNVTALDTNYENTGGYAINGSVVEFKKNVNLNGLGAFSIGKNGTNRSVVEFKGNNNIITAGVKGGLVAKDGGIVKFKGTIINREDTIPFLANDNSSIVFTGNTNIEMYKGALLSIPTQDREDNAENLNKKYSQLKKYVNIKIMDDGINLGVKSNQNITWDGNVDNFVNIWTGNAYKSFTRNNHLLEFSLINSTMDIATNINTSDENDNFNSIAMENVFLTIGNGVNISGENGLTIGSNASATSNTSTGFLNRGNIVITSSNKENGLYTSYGKVENQGKVEVKNGIGILGVNGSILSNSGTIKLGQGIGMYGLATIKNNPFDYGTDIDATNKKVNDITNTKKIEITNSSEEKISVGMYIDNNKENIAKSQSTLVNSGDITIGGENGIGIYSVLSNVNSNGNINVGNNGIGIFLEKSDFVGSGSFTLGSNGIGIYLVGNNNQFQINNDLIFRSDNKSYGVIFNDDTDRVIDNHNIDGSQFNNSILLYGKNMNLTNNAKLIVGKNSTGIYLDNSESSDKKITSNNEIVLSTAEKGIGIYALNTNIDVLQKIKLNGDSQFAIYAKNMQNKNINHAQKLDIKTTKTIGIYGKGSGNIHVKDIAIKNQSIGIYANGMNISVDGDINVGKNTAVGIISSNGGDINIDGNITVADKDKSSSIGIYKLDNTKNATINIANKNFIVGNSGYGIYLKNSQNVVVNNNSNITLGKASVGIYSDGNNNIINSGNITVGESLVLGKHDDIDKIQNSIGLYLKGGSSENKGTINVKYGHSIGIYATNKNTKFINNGDINVDNGGSGIFVNDGAVAINNKNITLGDNFGKCGVKNIGMASQGNGSKIINSKNGIITVGRGMGMVVNGNSTFDNSGEIIIKNSGIGISGNGVLTNTGKITIVGSGQKVSAGGIKPFAKVGAVIIKADGTIEINGEYVTKIGATLEVKDGKINLNGAFVNVAGGEKNEIPLFNATTVTGKIFILPDFLDMGDGITYKIDNFVKTTMSIKKLDTKIQEMTPIISPIFVAKITEDGSLEIAKRPFTYGNINVSKQFNNLYKGLDYLYKNSKKDNEVLRSMEKNLSNIFIAENKGNMGEIKVADYKRVSEHYYQQMRGDMYSTIQDRMQDIDKVFKNSFDELNNSYNNTKKVNKYSVISTDGEYKNSTFGIPNYKYISRGLLYMHEKEGLNYKNKSGSTFGFAYTKFDFDANSSGATEKVLSLRTGKNFTKRLAKNLFLLSNANIEYNRHYVKRKIHLNETYTNKAIYNSYEINLDNKLNKIIFQNFASLVEADLYFNAQYGKVESFNERGILDLRVKNNRYLSLIGGADIKGEHKFYLGNDFALKTFASGGFNYEFGNNYRGNKAKLKNGNNDYYDLITPEKKRWNVNGKIGLGFEKINQYGITFDIDYNKASNKIKKDIIYNLRLNYKF